MGNATLTMGAWAGRISSWHREVAYSISTDTHGRSPRIRNTCPDTLHVRMGDGVVLNTHQPLTTRTAWAREVSLAKAPAPRMERTTSASENGIMTQLYTRHLLTNQQWPLMSLPWLLRNPQRQLRNPQRRLRNPQWQLRSLPWQQTSQPWQLQNPQRQL